MVDDLRRICLEACVLVAFGTLVGLMLHHRLVLDAFSGKVAPPPRSAAAVATATAPGTLPMPVLLAEVLELLAAGALAVDARVPELFVEGHIAGAVSLPLGDVDDHLAGFLDQVPPERTLIAYCSGFGCPDSFDLGLRLTEAGYRDVRVYEGGFPEWRDAGLPVVEGAP